MMHWRSRATGICTGDQGIWSRAQTLHDVGGVPRQPLMEDIELSKKLKAVAKPVVAPVVLTTSPRRWRRGGVVRTIVRMWRFRWRYYRGATAEALAAEYADSG